MADNTVTLTFKVQSDGTLKQVTGDINKATKATDSLGAAQNRGAKGADNHNRAVNGGVGSANNAARANSRLLQTMGDNNSGLISAYATLAVNAFAVSAAFNILRTAAQAEQVMKGLEVQGARTGQALSVTARKVQELSGYTLSLADSMQATAQASAAGFDSKSIERLTKAASDASSALGRNMPDSMDRLVKGLTKMEPELLDELGAMTKLTEASKSYALQTGKSEASLSGLEKRAAFSNAVLAELELKFGGVASETSATVKGYDRLAAAFTDATTTGLNFISRILSPLVEFLAKNKLALLAVGVAFISSIKGQIIPGINELAKVQAEAARKQADASQKDVSTISKLTGGKRKAYNDLVQSIKDGSQTEQQYTAASVELADRRKQATEKVYKSQTTGEKLRAAQLAAIGDAETKLTAAQSAGAKSRRENAIASGLSATQDMNAFTAVSSLRQAMSQTSIALKANSDAKKASGDAAFSLAGQFSHLRSQAAITGKIMGSAMLNLLPIIGQVIAVIALLVAGFEALKSSQRKALETASNDLNRVIVNAINTVKELSRVESSTASLAARTEKDLIARGQAITELANAYKEVVIAAADAKNAEEGVATGVAGFTDAFFSTSEKSKQSYFLGLREDSEVLSVALRKNAQENEQFLGGVFNIFRTKQQIVTVDSIKTLDALSKLAPKETYDTVIALNGGLENIVGNAEKTAKVIEEIGTRSGQSAQATKDLTLSFKNADTALTEFFKSAIQSTPYDNIVKSFEAINMAIVDMTLAVPDSSNWAGLIAGIGPELEKMLETENRNAIQQARASDATIQGLKNKKELYGKLTSEQTKQLETEQGNLKNLQTQLPLIIANISKETERFILAQAQTREMQSQIGIIQAIMAKNQLAYTAGAAGEMARLNREEQIRNLQISALEVQKDILQSSLQQTQATLLEAEALRGVNKELDIQSSAKKNIAAQAELDRQKIEAERLKVPTAYITTTNIGGKDTFPAVAKGALNAQQLQQRNAVVYAAQNLASTKKQLEADREVMSLRSQERDIQSSINSIENQISSLRIQGLTTEQKAAKAKIAQVAFEQIITDLKAEQQALGTTNNTQAIKLASIQRGISSTLKDQLDTTETQYSTALSRITTEEKKKDDSIKAALGEVSAMKATASGEELKSYVAIEKNLNEQLVLNAQIAKGKKEENQTQRDIAILEALGIQNKTKGLEIQQQALEGIRKEFELRKELVSKARELYTITKEADAARLGGQRSEIAQKSDAYNAAVAEYKFAQEQFGLKKLEIELEYSLLEAKRLLMAEEIQTAKTKADTESAILLGRASTETDPTKKADLLTASTRLDTLGQQLGNAYESINKFNYDSLKDNAMKIAEMDIKILEKRATKAYYDMINSFIPQNPANKMIQDITDAFEIFKTFSNVGIDLEDSMSAALSPTVRAQQEQAKRQEANTVAEQNNTKALIENTNAKINPPAAVETAIKPTASELRDIFLPSLIPSGPRTSDFGARARPKAGASTFHAGLDIGARTGTPVYAPESGVVNLARMAGGYGKRIELALGQIEGSTEEVVTTYSHLSKFAVQQGETVKKGQLLGYTGRSGVSTGPHLHFEVLVNGQKVDPTKPTTVGIATQTTTQDGSIVVTGKREETVAQKDIRQLNEEQISEGIKAASANVEKSTLNIEEKILRMAMTIRTGVQSSVEALKELGPQGQLFASLTEGITGIAMIGAGLGKTMSKNYTDFHEDEVAKLKAKAEAEGRVFDATTENLTDKSEFQALKISAAFSAAAGVIGAISSITKASSDAKIAGIDKEIAAEQKRDGKSAASVAKLEALEKKKDSTARKAFNTNKKLMMAQAVMSTAAAIASTLATAPDPVTKIVMAGIIGAMGLAQVAVIAGTQYESGATAKSASMPTSLSIGKRSDTVDLARGPNANAGAEAGYLRGAQGTGTNATNYRTTGSAYGGELMRGYGNRGFVVGEKGPEVITPDTPITVTPANDVGQAQSINASFNIQALDSNGVQDILVAQKGNIIKMLREASNASGKSFMEDVNVNVYTRPSVGKL